MNELMQYVDAITDNATALVAAISIHVKDPEEQRRMLAEINNIMEYGLHNLRQSIEDLDAAKNNS